MPLTKFLSRCFFRSPDRIVDESVFSFDVLKEKADQIKQRRRSRAQGSKAASVDEETRQMLEDEYEEQRSDNPLRRTGRLFGGLTNDLKRRMPYYKSDITDGLNAATVATTLFM